MVSLMAKPAAQAGHEEDPNTSAYLPTAQALHALALVCFNSRLLLPKGHFSQVCCPFNPWYSPAGQGTHAPSLVNVPLSHGLEQKHSFEYVQPAVESALVFSQREFLL